VSSTRIRCDSPTPVSQNEEPTIDSCSLCAELAGIGTPLHTKLMPFAPEERILIQSPHFVVVPSIGPLRVGHVMIVSRSHVGGILRMGADELVECEQLAEICVRRLIALYGGSILIFEHGSACRPSSLSAACVEHAHLHLLPGPIEFVNSVRCRLKKWETGRTLLELSGDAVAAGYILVGSSVPVMGYHLHVLSASVPSQMLRQQYAAMTGQIEAWDWRKAPRQTEFIQTLMDWRRESPKDHSIPIS
jgi:diadenosine tetraphosphate (Ap4A) HIT family hydrolase